MFLSRAPLRVQALCVRLACIRHAASVRPEPGSNSSLGERSAPSTRHNPAPCLCWTRRNEHRHDSVVKVQSGDGAEQAKEKPGDAVGIHLAGGSGRSTTAARAAATPKTPELVRLSGRSEMRRRLEKATSRSVAHKKGVVKSEWSCVYFLATRRTIPRRRAFVKQFRAAISNCFTWLHRAVIRH